MDEAKLLKFFVPWIFLSISYLLLDVLLGEQITFGRGGLEPSVSVVVLTFGISLEVLYIPKLVEKFKNKINVQKTVKAIQFLLITLSFVFVSFIFSDLFSVTNFLFVLPVTLTSMGVIVASEKTIEYFFKKISWL